MHKQVVRKAASARAIEMDPATKLYFVEVEEPDMHKPTGDLERLAHALKDQWDIDNVTCDLGVMTKLQPRLRKGNGRLCGRLPRSQNRSGPYFGCVVRTTRRWAIWIGHRFGLNHGCGTPDRFPRAKWLQAQV